MGKEISKGLKWTFFTNYIVSLVFGVLLFFLVETYLGWFGIPFTAPFVFGGLFGGALLGYASASFIAWKQTEWESVKITVIMEVVFNMLGAFIFFYMNIAVWQLPSIFLYTKIMDLIYLILFLGFLISFIFFYIQHEKEKKEK
ncbi:MAG: hypothetical protein ACFFKA_13915 [Candidatus Thorarchaeota archaeon]